MKKEISLIFTRTRTPCKQGFIVLYSDVRDRDLLKNVCTGSQLKFREVYIPQYDGPYRCVQPQRVWFFVLV